MNWPAQLQKRIFPVSREKADLRVALEEWEYRENIYDLGYPEANCELCGYAGIRYQFEIVNRHNGNHLLIGSECVTKFGDIGIFESSQHISDPLEASRKVARDKGRLITAAHTKAVINSLITLARIDTEFGENRIEDFITYYEERGAFTPLQLATLVWRLEKHHVEFKPQYLRMTIKRKVERDQFLNLKDWRIRKMYKALSLNQKRFLMRCRPELFNPRLHRPSSL